MAKVTLHLLLLISLISFTFVAYSRSSVSSFITSSCSTTHYPDVCIASLFEYSDKIQKSSKEMVEASLKVSLAKAKSTKSFFIQMYKSKGLEESEYNVMKDCINMVTESVDRIHMSVDEFGHLSDGEKAFKLHINNVQIWLSAALSDDHTCMDGFDGMEGKLKSAVKSKIDDTTKVIRNALALVNQFAKRN